MSATPVFLAMLRSRLRQRVWLQALLVALAGASAVAGFTGTASGLSPLLSAAIAGLLVLMIYRLQHPAFAADDEAMVEHLNRCIPALEESAGLWLRPAEQLTTLERLQRARVEPTFAALGHETQRWLPALRWRMPLLIMAVGTALLGWSALPGTSAGVNLRGSDGELKSVSEVPSLIRITVTPPAYMDAVAFDEQDFNVSLPEGARVTWQLVNPSGDPLRLAINNAQHAERTLDFSAGGEGDWRASTVIRETSLYRLEQQGENGYEALPGVYSLAVTLDRPPRLRMLAPRTNRLEVPADGDPHFDYQVSVTDDYGIAEVEILASVAKGSGEGVKFRDQQFVFTDYRMEGGARIYERHWDLEALGMEPGDEVYLFTRARDNHPGKVQQGRSDTLVVRWLDETEVQQVSDGLAISVMPEYFKSQRQIIIETEQLIADREVLSEPVFVQTSRDLGVAQSELKERYGQYLGDEFGESEAPSGLITEAAGNDDDEGDHEGDDDDHSGHDHAADDHAGHDHAGHDHGAEAGGDLPQTAAALIARFGHDHGSAEIGPITRRSPVGLMKRAVANMWDAELQLRLANPEAALPYEYEALKYFDLARQAERIYTQRLGFEPPPVSEERRLSGELDDVRSRERQLAASPDPSTAQLMSDLFRLLNNQAPGTELNATQTQLLAEAAAVFAERASERPALIRSAAYLEQMRVSGRLLLEDCEGCLAALRRATWSLLPAPVPAPGRATRPKPDDLGAQYLERINALSPGVAQ